MCSNVQINDGSNCMQQYTYFILLTLKAHTASLLKHNQKDGDANREIKYI